MSKIRFSYTQRVSQFNSFCQLWMDGADSECESSAFYVSDYAHAVGVTTSYAGRLLARFREGGLVHADKVEGHNQMGKWLYYADTNQQLPMEMAYDEN